MRSQLKIIVITFGVIVMTAWLASDSRYFTPGLAGVWGIIACVGLLQSVKDQEQKPILNISNSLQVMLAVFLIVATAVSTTWNALGQRDMIQGGYLLFTLPVYRRGFTWYLQRLLSFFHLQPKNVP